MDKKMNRRLQELQSELWAVEEPVEPEPLGEGEEEIFLRDWAEGNDFARTVFADEEPMEDRTVSVSTKKEKKEKRKRSKRKGRRYGLLLLLEILAILLLMGWWMQWRL